MSQNRSVRSPEWPIAPDRCRIGVTLLVSARITPEQVAERSHAPDYSVLVPADIPAPVSFREIVCSNIHDSFGGLPLSTHRFLPLGRPRSPLRALPGPVVPRPEAAPH